jgi:hypothetical protein
MHGPWQPDEELILFLPVFVGQGQFRPALNPGNGMHGELFCVEGDIVQFTACCHFEAVGSIDPLVDKIDGHGHMFEPYRQFRKIFASVFVVSVSHASLPGNKNFFLGYNRRAKKVSLASFS